MRESSKDNTAGHVGPRGHAKVLERAHAVRRPVRFGLGVCVFSGACILITARPSHAYLDGGTGSMMLQLLLGGLAGVGIGLRLYWRRLLDALGIRSDHTERDSVDPDPDSPTGNDIPK